MFAPSATQLTCLTTQAVADILLPTLPPPLPTPPPALPTPPPALPPTPAGEYGKIPKLFSCSICNITIKGRRSNLNRHIIEVHSDFKKVECGLCGKRFKQASLLKHAKECQGLETAPSAPAPVSPPPSAPAPVSPPPSAAASPPPSAAASPPPSAAASPPPSAAASPPPSAAASPTPRPSVVQSPPFVVDSPPLLNFSPVATPPPPSASAPCSLTSDVIDAASADFIAWLAEPVLPTEHMIRKVATPAALTVLRQQVRQLVRDVAKALPELFAGGVHLRLVVVPAVVSALVAAMEARGVQAATVYATALLLKKVCVWLCSRQSRATKQYIAPDTLPGWPVICHHCTATTRERKRVHKSRRLRNADKDKWMTTTEKNTLLSACLRVLDDIRRNTTEETFGISSDFTDHLVVALLLLGLAPRPQTFRELTVDMVRPPGSDPSQPDQYILDGEHGKTKMTYYMAVHPVLTSSMRFYLERVLGRGYKGPLFLQMGGTARQDFSLTTRALTMRYIGRPITASKFRKTVATDLRGKPGVQDKSLADMMGHTVATQQGWYIGADMAKDARVCQDALLQGVEVPAGMM